MRKLSRILILPAVVNIFLASLVIIIWYFYNPQSSPQVPVDATSNLDWALQDITQFTTSDSMKLAAIETQPLFHQTRKPAIIKPVKKPEIQDSRSSLNDFQLKGIVYKEMGSIAYVHNRLKNIEHQLHEGDSLDSWKIKSITKTEIVLVRDSQRGMLSLLGKTTQ